MKIPPHSVEWLDAVKTKTGIGSDYALAEELGITRQAICQQRAGKQEMSTRAAVTAAQILGVPVLVVLAAVMYHGDRVNNQQFWLEVWERAEADRKGSGPPPRGRQSPPA